MERFDFRPGIYYIDRGISAIRRLNEYGRVEESFLLSLDDYYDMLMALRIEISGLFIVKPDGTITNKPY